MYRNSEHYSDPTAGEALARISRAEKFSEKSKQQSKDGEHRMKPKIGRVKKRMGYIRYFSAKNKDVSQ